MCGRVAAPQFQIDSDHHLSAILPKATATEPVTVTVQLQDRSLTGPPFSYQADPAGGGGQARRRRRGFVDVGG